MRVAQAAVFSPRQLGSIANGAFYLPGEYNGLGTAGFEWPNLRGGSGDFYVQPDVAKQPTPGVGPSGNPIWTLDGGDTISVLSPSSLIRFSTRGTYAYWLRLAADDANFQCVFSHDDGTTGRRLAIWKYNAPGQYQAFPSADGTTVVPHVVDGINAAAWNYYEWRWANSQPADTRLRLFVNRVEVSLLGDGPTLLRSNVGVPSYLWSNNDAGQYVTGEFGPLYICNEQTGAQLSDAQRDQLYRYLAPVVIP